MNKKQHVVITVSKESCDFVLNDDRQEINLTAYLNALGDDEAYHQLKSILARKKNREIKY